MREQHPDVLGVQECWGTDERTQADVLAQAIGGHASLLLADLNYDRSPPPLAGMDLVDAWDAAHDGVDERTLSSTNRAGWIPAVGSLPGGGGHSYRMTLAARGMHCSGSSW